jgi:flagellar motor switch/type III secretory pathway protein FliN
MLMELPHADLELGVSRRDGVLPAQGAIAKQTVRVDVRLGESELDLGSLQTLSVGDVLRLDKKLDEGVELHVGDQRLPCIGYLAAHDGDVVIELARR